MASRCASWRSSAFTLLLVGSSAIVRGTVHCLDQAQKMVATLHLAPLSEAGICSASAFMFVDIQRTMVLKHVDQIARPVQNRSLQREACVLQKLQRFDWAPRLICAGIDYILTEYRGRPVCREAAPARYAALVGSILSDLHSLSIRHNDLRKGTRTDFVFDHRTHRMSLTDYGWASVNGSLSMSCVVNGRSLVVNEHPMAWNISKELRDGFSMPETSEAVSLPRCEAYRDARKGPGKGPLSKPESPRAECMQERVRAQQNERARELWRRFAVWWKQGGESDTAPSQPASTAHALAHPRPQARDARRIERDGG